MNILLLHGFVGHADIHFLPFLRRRLSAYGEIFCPSLPSPDAPKLEEWTDCVRSWSEGRTIDMTICHSLGGTLALSMISRRFLEPRTLVTIGSSHGPKSEDVMNGFLDPPLSISRIREIEKFYAVTSLDDPWTHPEYSTLLVKQCGAVGLFYQGLGHFECETLPDELMTLIEARLRT